jgi:hypothetical protein
VREGRVVVRPRHFSSDALHGRTLLRRYADAAPSTDSTTAGSPPCLGLPKDAQAVAAEYQHAPAALVYRRVQDDLQVVDLYVCGDGRPIRSTTLPAP